MKSPRYANVDTNLERCTKGQLIDIVRECQRALLDLNEAHMDLVQRSAEVARPMKAYNCCPKHMGVPFTMEVHYAPPMIQVCPHCEAAFS